MCTIIDFDCETQRSCLCSIGALTGVELLHYFLRLYSCVHDHAAWSGQLLVRLGVTSFESWGARVRHCCTQAHVHTFVSTSFGRAQKRCAGALQLRLWGISRLHRSHATQLPCVLFVDQQQPPTSSLCQAHHDVIVPESQPSPPRTWPWRSSRPLSITWIRRSTLPREGDCLPAPAHVVDPRGYRGVGNRHASTKPLSFLHTHTRRGGEREASTGLIRRVAALCMK